MSAALGSVAVMDIILVPGLWLDASSWSAVTPALERAGHTVHPLTMPGVGAPATESSDIGMADWVAAVVDVIDRMPGSVVLVGHSGGGNVVYGAADARPERVAHIVFVDTFPVADGGIIWEFPIVDGLIPFPGWESFETAEIADLDESARAAAAAQMAPIPARVPTDPLRLSDERRRGIPATMLAGAFPADEVRRVIEAGPEWASELVALKNLDIVDLGSGHWPQFSVPERLSDAILAAVDRA